tara:strand:- start:2827 stop:3603 length:777 start_codon:yes stop_codon:yes gene_type:complete
MIIEKNLKSISTELVKNFHFAGKESLDIRKKGLKIKYKDDSTPVSNGDILVNKIVTEKISELTPNIPIVSEESSNNKSKIDLQNFWLVDPIDGTYDYINNKDEFTINAGLIINKKPELGVIYAPAKGRMFYTHGINESYELTNGKVIKLDCKKKTNENQIKAVHYSDKLKPIIHDYHNKFGVTEFHKMKSSLKFCVIASSEFDIYVSEPRASEWDIAAGHAILRNAGGIIKDFDGGEVLYGKKDFKNPSLILKREENL